MNEIQNIDRAIYEINQRAEYLKTRQGQTETAMKMLEVFGVLRGCGYRVPDEDPKAMAKIWAFTLSDYVAIYGNEKIEQAVIHFAKNDAREYKSFPKPAEIIESIKAVGGRDPRLIKADREAEERSKRIKAEIRKEFDERWATLSPAERNRIMQQARERMRVKQ